MLKSEQQTQKYWRIVKVVFCTKNSKWSIHLENGSPVVASGRRLEKILDAFGCSRPAKLKGLAYLKKTESCLTDFENFVSGDKK